VTFGGSFVECCCCTGWAAVGARKPPPRRKPAQASPRDVGRQNLALRTQRQVETQFRRVRASALDGKRRHACRRCGLLIVQRCERRTSYRATSWSSVICFTDCSTSVLRCAASMLKVSRTLPAEETAQVVTWNRSVMSWTVPEQRWLLQPRRLGRLGRVTT
jgi:hypothetical protein